MQPNNGDWLRALDLPRPRPTANTTGWATSAAITPSIDKALIAAMRQRVAVILSAADQRLHELPAARRLGLEIGRGTPAEEDAAQRQREAEAQLDDGIPTVLAVGRSTHHPLRVTNFFRGNPRLLVQALPVALGMIVLKWLYDESSAMHLDFSPLLTGVIAAEVFIVGFMLAGTAGDFKEAERLPGELAASLETVADECLIIDADLKLPDARQCVAQLVVIGHSVRMWLLHDKGFDEVMADLRALNPLFIVFAPNIQAGFTTRLKSEQANMRKLVIRMDTMRRTSYVSAGYLIAEITALVILVLLLVTEVGQLAPTVLVVGLISYLLIYVLALIRDLDNPFEYREGKPGAADVNLEVLERSEDRLRGLLTTMGAWA